MFLRSCLVLMSVMAATACGSISTPPSPAISDSKPPPGPSAAAAPAASAAPPSDGAAAEATVELNLVEVGELPFEIQAIDGTLAGYVSYGDSTEIARWTFKLFVLEGNRFERIWRHDRSPFDWVGPHGIYGSPHGPLDVIGMKPGARSSDPRLDTVIGPKASVGTWGHPVGLASRDGATYSINVVFGSAKMETLRGAPSLSQQPPPDGCRENGYGYPRIIAERLIATRGGDLIAAGLDCDDTLALEVWKKGSTTSAIVRLEERAVVGVDASENWFDAAPGGDAFVLGAALRRWDGSKLAAIDPPLPAPATAAFDLPDGRLIVQTWNKKERAAYVKEGSLWRRAVLPGGQPLKSVVSDGKNVWGYGGASAQLRKLVPVGAKAEPLAFDPKELPDVSARREKELEDVLAGRKARFLPGGPQCKTNVVVLFGFTKVTPYDYDFPLTRKAIKGHTELKGIKFAVTSEADQKFFVGLAPSFQLAKKLQTVIESGVQGSKPQVVCAEPELIRELDIDLATGELAR